MPDLPCTPPRFARILAPLVVAAAVSARLYLMVATHRTAEDFFITLRYARNIADGLGFAYNPGERVLGTTTPLYTLLLAAIIRCGANPVLWGRLANIAADGAACFLLWRLGRGIGRPMAGLLAAALLALWPPSLYWSISGMETSLVTLCGLGVFVGLAERRPLAAAGWSAALLLLRIDGLLLVAVALAAAALSLRRADACQAAGAAHPGRAYLLAVALLAGLVLPWVLFAAVYFGSPVPTSLTAKLAVYSWHSRGALPNLAPFARTMTGNAAYWLLLAGLIPGLWAVGKTHRTLAPAAIWMLLYFAGMAFSKAFLFGWYYVPPAPIYALVSVLGCAWMVGRLVRPGTMRVLAAGASATVVAAGAALLPRQARMITLDQRADEQLLEPIGLVLRDIVRPGDQVMLEPIGWIGYYSGARILDSVGLVSPEAIRFYRSGAASPYLDMMAALKPEWVLLRAGEYHDALAAAVPPDRALGARYTLARTFKNPSSPASAPAFYLLQRIPPPGR